MKKVQKTNINTFEYWNSVYTGEKYSDKHRVDVNRCLEVLRWCRVRQEELGRTPSFLDAGCGLGEVPKFLRTHYPTMQILGIDLSVIAVEHCQMLVLGKNVYFKSASIYDIPAPPGSFDVVWCGETLEHLDDPTAAIMEFKRVVGDGGLIIISTPYRGRNKSNEHVWEFAPDDIWEWGKMCGELVFLDCRILPNWLTMFAVIRKAEAKELS